MLSCIWVSQPERRRVRTIAGIRILPVFLRRERGRIKNSFMD
jgi:hypothetical protein